MPLIEKRPRGRPRKTETRGRKPISQRIRATWIDHGRSVRLTLSEDIVQTLKHMHDEMFSVFYLTALRRQRDYDPYKAIRIEFVPFNDMSIPAVLVRIEPPTFDPQGHRLWRPGKGRRFYVQVRAAAIGLLEGQPATELDFIYQEHNARLLGGGIMVIYPDRVTAFPGPKNRRPIKEGKLPL